MYKKRLPTVLTKEQWLKIDYAIAKYMHAQEPIAVTEQFPDAFLTVKVTKEPTLPHQLWFHLRITDSKSGRVFDLDVYLPTEEIRKFIELKEEMDIKELPYMLEEFPTQLEPLIAIPIVYQYEGKTIRETRIALTQKGT